MPRGSKIGERRGGRQRGTPNRRTVLADRILAIASERPTTSAGQLVDILVKDHELPADIRMAIALEFLSAGTSRSVGASAVRSSAHKRRKAESTARGPSRQAIRDWPHSTACLALPRTRLSQRTSGAKRRRRQRSFSYQRSLA